MSDTSNQVSHALKLRDALALWGTDSGPFMALVADDVKWRIIGSTAVSGTHLSKKAFAAATAPLGARFTEPLRVEIKSVHEDGDTVFLEWEGKTSAVNGRTYEQSYCWIIRMADAKAVEVVVYLDTALIDDMFRD